MKNALIIYESKYGNTELVAQKIAEGMQSAGIETKLTKPKGVDFEGLAEFDAILFGCPVHVFNATRGIKKVIDKVAKTGITGKFTTTFETYMGDHLGKAVTKMEGKIAKKMSGCALEKPGFSALVEGMEGPVADEDLGKAIEFGKRIGNMIT